MFIHMAVVLAIELVVWGVCACVVLCVYVGWWCPCMDGACCIVTVVVFAFGSFVGVACKLLAL